MARPPLAHPVKPPLLGAGEPVLDTIGVERIPLVPGTKAARPLATKATPPAPAPPIVTASLAAPLVAPHPPAAPAVMARPSAAPGPTAPAAPVVAMSVTSPNVQSVVPSSLPSATQPTRRVATINELILDSIRLIPEGGDYRADANSIELLRTAVTIADNRLQVVPDFARPSFCSSATYLVFLLAMDRLHRDNRVQLPPAALNALLIRGQHDGEGVWGRWNANGPGTARLFHELGLGDSFSNPMAARPGDFLKIWWNDEIGARERGHSVIFLGLERTPENEVAVRYWSSNKPGGFGEGVAPMSKVKRMLFSRLETPRALAAAASLPRKDTYLADMLKRASTEEEMAKMCGVR